MFILFCYIYTSSTETNSIIIKNSNTFKHEKEKSLICGLHIVGRLQQLT